MHYDEIDVYVCVRVCCFRLPGVGEAIGGIVIEEERGEALTTLKNRVPGGHAHIR